jgi:hypothetical protein
MTSGASARHRADGARACQDMVDLRLRIARGIARQRAEALRRAALERRVAAETSAPAEASEGARRDASAPHLSTAGEIERLRASAVALSAELAGWWTALFHLAEKHPTEAPRSRATAVAAGRDALRAAHLERRCADEHLAVMRDTNVSATPRGDAARPEPGATRDAARTEREGSSTRKNGDAAESGERQNGTPPENKTPPRRRNAASDRAAPSPAKSNPPPPHPSRLLERLSPADDAAVRAAEERATRAEAEARDAADAYACLVEAVNREHLAERRLREAKWQPPGGASAPPEPESRDGRYMSGGDRSNSAPNVVERGGSSRPSDDARPLAAARGGGPESGEPGTSGTGRKKIGRPKGSKNKPKDASAAAAKGAGRSKRRRVDPGTGE